MNTHGLLNIQDIVIIINFILNIEIPTDQEIEIADMNDDGTLNDLDVSDSGQLFPPPHETMKKEIPSIRINFIIFIFFTFFSF